MPLFNFDIIDTKEEILPNVPQCGLCNLYKNCKNPKMKIFGKGEKGIMIISESPGVEEDAAGELLVGNSGKELAQQLLNRGIDIEEDCWLYHSLICEPGDRKTSIKNIEYCRPNIIREIKEKKPSLILLLGGGAIASLIPYLWENNDLKNVASWAGECIPSQKINAWVCPLFNPAYVLRSKNEVAARIFKNHLFNALKYKDKGRPWEENNIPDYASQVDVILDSDIAYHKLLKFIETPRVVAFDYETNCLNPKTKGSEIYCVSVSDRKTTLAFLWNKKIEPLMKKMFSNPNFRFIACNLNFENRWTIEKMGVYIKNWEWDTLTAAHVLNTLNGQNTSIKFQAFVQLGQPLWSKKVSAYLEDDKNKLNRIHEVDKSTLLKYCGLDSLLEYLVAQKQKKIMKGFSYE